MSIVTMGIIASTLAGLATGVGALPALVFKNVSDKILNTMIGGAAGAMLFVISDEIIPETHSKGKSRLATFGVMVGFVIRMALDNLLG